MNDISWADAFKKEKKLLEKVKSTIKDSRKYLSKKYRDIGLGEAFYEGLHYGEWDDKSLSWREEDINDDDRPRLVSNQVKVYVDKAVTKIIRYKPAIMATPMSNEEVDIKGSKVSEEMIQHKFMEQDIDDIQERWVKNSCSGGIGWVKCDFNPFLGDSIEDFEETQLPDGTEVEIKKEKIYKGDIEYTLPRPGNIIPDISNTEWKKNRYLIEEMMIDIHTLKANYKKAKDMKSDKYLSSSKDELNKRDFMVKVWELWFKPCPEFESGGYAIGTEDMVLDIITPYPHEHKRLPYVPLPFSSSNDCLWGNGVCQPIIPLQVEYNKIRNVRIENQNYAAAIKFLNPLTSGWDGDMMTNEPGEVIDYDGQTPPGWSQPLTASEELNSSLAEIKQEMQDISMVSATSQGKPPEGMRSGIGIQYLIENDDSSFVPVIRRMENGIRELCYMTLELMKQYYEDEDDRYYKVIGANKEYQLKKFKKASLKGKYDVIIQNSNANPLSKAYKMDTIMQLIQYQILNAQDRPFISEALEVGNLKGVHEDIQADQLRAQKEIDKLVQGKPHEIIEYDDDATHIVVKQRYLKSEYDNLSPEQRFAIIDAIKQHEEQALQKQPPMPPQGMPPEGGETPPEAALPMAEMV